MLKKINEIVDGWDPMGLFPFAPKDEYTDESVLIERALEKTSNERLLGEEIQRIFINSFGAENFTNSIDECVEIAHSIIQCV
jgi:hypothetical protein